ncbi:anti-sigma factor domain-containing protein [Niallia oryzisoli]|uniref:Anti-sigma factor domain-containing protein n=1 Tax=Niallia oryzisoli TaxID=1737571 RepID=A0ABZ2C8S8_9BACI
MKKGIILEINDRFVTLLTPEGEFLRARKLNNDYQIGQEIDFFPDKKEMENKSFSIFHTFKGKALAASFASLLLLVSLIPLYQGNQVYAYMSIDINPSIELGFNKDYQVISITPYNEDGEKIVNQLKGWKKKGIDEVTNDIIDEIKRQGYLKDNHEIVVGTVYETETIDVDNPNWKEKWTDVQEVIQGKHLELTVVKGTEEDREIAQKQGVTIGEYKEESKSLNKNHSKKQKDQKEKPVKEELPQQEQQTDASSPKVEEHKPAVEPSKQSDPPVNTPQDGKAKPAIESTPHVAPGQIKKENNFDQYTGEVKGPELDKAHPSEKEKKPEQAETKADNEKQKNNENNGNHNGNNGSNGNFGNQGKQGDSSDKNNEKN